MKHDMNVLENLAKENASEYMNVKNILLTTDDHAEPKPNGAQTLDTVSKNISTIKLNLTHNILCECDRWAAA